MPPALETALYRIAREALTHVRKHADTTRVDPGLDLRDREIHLEVRDQGRGFDENDVVMAEGPGERVGLSGMEARVALLSGEFEIQSKPGDGTLVMAPLVDSARERGERG